MPPWLRFPLSAGTRGFIAAGLFFAAVLACVPIHYETNDDLCFIWTLNGGDGYPAAPFVMFTSQWLNGIFFSLYSHFPAVPWWGILILTSTFLATALLFGVAFRLGKPAWLLLPMLLYFLLYSLGFISVTSATVLLELSTLLCLYEISLAGKTPVKHPLPYLTLLTACLSLSLLMRWEIALYFLALGLCPIACLPRLSALRNVGLVILLAGAGLAADRVAFQTSVGKPEKEYIAYNALRSRFHDTHAGEFHPGVTEAALAKVGWTPADYLFFHKWVVYDDSLFSPEKIAAFLKANTAPELRRVAVSIAASAWSAKRHMLLLILTLLAIALAFQTAWKRAAWRNRIRVTVPFAVNAAAILFFMEYRFVARVYVPLFVFTAAGLLLALRWNAPDSLPGPRSVRALRVALGTAALCALFSALMLYDTLRHDRQESMFIASSLRAAQKDGLRAVVDLDPNSGLRLENLHPLAEKILPAGLAYFPEGSSIRSPRYDRVLRSMGLGNGREFLRFIVDNDTLGLVLHDRDIENASVTLRLWEEYYRQHFPDWPVRLALLREFRDPKSGVVRFYRLESVVGESPVGQSGPLHLAPEILAGG